LRTVLSLPVRVRQRSTSLPRRSQSLANDSKSRLTKRHGHCWSTSRAILMSRRRGRNSSMLRESKRPFIRNLMVSAWAKKAVNPAPLCGASLGSFCRRLKSVLGAGKDLWYTAIAKNKKVSLPFFRGSKMQGSPPWNFLRANYSADLHQSASSSSSSSGIAMDRIVGAFSAPEKKTGSN
jgi:hypothetical protein